MLDDLTRDLRHGARILRASPAFAIVVAATLAIAIGASVTVFSIVDSWLLRPLNFPRADRLAIGFYAVHERPAEPAVFALYRDYLGWAERSRSFELLSAAFPRRYLLGGLAEPATARGLAVTPEFFEALGVAPQLGRTLSARDATGPAAAVLSYGLWQRQFGGAETVVGTRVILNGAPHDIVGVMPRDFEMRILDEARGFELWTLFPPGEAAYRPGGSGGVAVIGRLRDGVTVGAAQNELAVIHRDVESGYTPNASRFDVLLTSLQADNTRTVRTTLMTVGGAVIGLLLIACLNVGTLLAGRGLARARETAIRAAIGSSRARLARQFLAESLLLSSIGGIAGIATALAATRLFAAWNPIGTLPAAPIQVDLRALSVAAALMAATTILCGLVPALRMAATDPAEVLRSGGEHAADGRPRRAQELLLTIQIAVSVLLLVTTALLARSFVRLHSEPLGFDAANLSTVTVALPTDEFDTGARRNIFYRQLADRLETAPGVQRVAAGTSLLFSNGAPVPVRTSTEDTGTPLRISAQDVTANFFETLGIARIAGRVFDDRDVAAAPAVVVLNERAAQMLYGSPAGAVGRRIRAGDGVWSEVAGVVANTRSTAFNTVEWLTAPVIFVPAPQGFTSIRNPTSPSFELHLHVRASRPLSLAQMRPLVAALSARAAVTQVQSAPEAVAQATRLPAFRMTLLGGFAALTLLLAAIGAYGLVSQSIARRMREIGIRLALGAKSTAVMREVAGRTVATGIAGAGCGCGAALALGRPIESVLYGVHATDAVSYVFAGTLLVAVTTAAALVPAWRAARIDPIEILRAE